MAVVYQLGTTDWIQARLRVINPHDLDVKNPTSYIDVPVIVQITFHDAKDRGQDYCHGIDNSDDSGRKYHIFRVCNQAGEPSDYIVDQSNWLDVERIECFPMLSAKERSQQFGRITGNTDLPGGWPAQPGDLSSDDRSGSFRTVYRYTTDNTKDGVPWIDMECQLIVPQSDAKPRDDKKDFAKTGQVRAFLLKWFQDPAVPVDDADDPYKPSLGFCDPDLPLITDNPLLTFEGINDNSRLLAGEPPRFRAGRYPLPTTFVTGGAEDELPDDPQFPRCGYRFDPFQNPVNINWSDCVEFEVDKVKVPPGEHTMGVGDGPNVAILKQDASLIPDFERMLFSTWINVVDGPDGVPKFGSDIGGAYRIIEWSGSAPFPFFKNTSYVQVYEDLAEGATSPTMFLNIKVVGPLKTGAWESLLPNFSPWPCKPVDVPSEFFYTDATAQFSHKVELLIDTKMSWEKFKADGDKNDGWHNIVFSMEANTEDLKSVRSEIKYKWDRVATLSIANEDFSGGAAFISFSQFYLPPFLPCATGDLSLHSDHFSDNFTGIYTASDAWRLEPGNEFGPVISGEPPSGYGPDGFPLPEGFAGELRSFVWHNNVAGPPAWYWAWVVSRPTMTTDNDTTEPLTFSVRMDGKLLAKTGDHVAAGGGVPKIDVFGLGMNPLTASSFPPDDTTDLFVIEGTQVALPRQTETGQQAFDIPHRYAETQVWFQNTEYVDLTDDAIYAYFARKYEDPRNPGKFLLKPQEFTPAQKIENAHNGFPADILLSPATLRFGKPTLYFKGGRGSVKDPPPLDLGGFPQNRGTGGRFVKVNIIENFAPGPLKVPVLV